MTAPNRATLWGETIVEELAASGLGAAVVAPGSRSTPLAVALAAHEGIRVHSHLDERSAAFFALGRGKATGEPTAVVTTSGTAAANCHPAVVEAHQARVPLLVLTADRPAELHDSGANQTVDQADLYGDSVRWHRTLPEPAPEARRLRSLRTTVCRAVGETTGTPPGPVHLNVPVAKPLEPIPDDGDVPEALARDAPLGAEGREGPFVRTTAGRPTPDDADVDRIATAISGADRGLVVAGPANGRVPAPTPVRALVEATDFPVFADPLSGHRFGSHVTDLPVCGGYDAFLTAVEDWPDPDVVVRFGASPTSKALRHYLRDSGARQFVVDPAGGWREAEFAATDLVVADPDALCRALADRVDAGDPAWRERVEAAEATHWAVLEDGFDDGTYEGSIAATVAESVPDPGALVLSNSMPVRDVDRFARPRAVDVRTLGNRGASGIDGVTSTALGAADALSTPLVALVGDVAFLHDTNGLGAVARSGVDATIVVVNNDGGGIFHKLPIEAVDPPFTELFKTPHGLDFGDTAAVHDLGFERVESEAALATAIEDSVAVDGTQVIEVRVDAAESHARRDALADRLGDRL